ncbi:MAG TPA: glycosyltransferase family 2 protein [Gemmatimonadaceae bacterium]|nr:glycosyltransferase family 2 protein [Gemmatimonadaceae bacterium]
MLYICIPAYNEAPTIGVLLWRIRKVLKDFPREYEIVVFDDGSTDATAETLQPYGDVLPLSILGGERHVGYAGALDALCRAVVAKTRYPRRDAMLLMQGDFTDQPEHIPELVKRFEGGADIVVAERTTVPDAPVPVRRLRRMAPWLLRPFMSVPGVADPFASFRLIRITVLRDVIKQGGDSPIVAGLGWAANVDLLSRAMPYARRIETVSLEQRYDIRPRPSRIRPFADALNLYRFAWATRGRRIVPPPATAT